jgi:hypothetical protein
MPGARDDWGRSARQVAYCRPRIVSLNRLVSDRLARA